MSVSNPNIAPPRTQPPSLWPHQRAAIQAAHDAIARGKGSGLWSLPTGTGKTIAFISLARELGWSTLILNHRDEISCQTRDALATVWPAATVGVIRAGQHEVDEHDVVVASVPSMHAERLKRISRDRFGLVIVDEAHHCTAPTWAAVLDWFQADFTLGCTATPERADGRGLSERFGPRPIYFYPLRQAIDDGHLARLTQFAIESSADIDGVAYRVGDFATHELSRIVNTAARNRVVVEAYQQHAGDRRALAFTVDVAHALDLRDAFTQAGIPAATVTGTTPRDERRQLLADFAAGKVRVMCNCAVLTEGFDDPGIGAILMARPTCSRPLYMQCVGRGLRQAPGKRDCLVLDFLDNSRRHKLVTVLDLLGAPHARNANGKDVLHRVDADRAEAERQHEIEVQAPLSWRLINVSPWPKLATLAGYVPMVWWHPHQASDRQIAYLRSFGLDTSRPLSKGECAFLIDRAVSVTRLTRHRQLPNRRTCCDGPDCGNPVSRNARRAS